MGLWGKIKNRPKAEYNAAPVVDTKQKIKPQESKAAKPVTDAATLVKHDQQTSDYGHRILLKPVITEKSSHLHVMNQYVFRVATDATKLHVRKAVEEVFGVTPVAVRMVSRAGKRVQFRRRAGQRVAVKKAIVTLRKGQSIKIYEGV